MKKLLMLVLSLCMMAGGFAYYQDTLSHSAPEKAPEGKGIAQAFRDRYDNPINRVTLFPAIYGNDFDADNDKVNGYWDSTKISGAKDHVLHITNEGETPCYFRTFVAFENSGDVFDKLITVNWKSGFDVVKLDGDLTIDGDQTGVEKYRVYMVTMPGNGTLAAGDTAAPLLQLYLAREADNSDISALGDEYTVRAVTEAVWKQPDGDAENGLISLNLLTTNPEDMERIQGLFTPVAP